VKYYPGLPERAKLGEGSLGLQASSSKEEEAGSTDTFSDGERSSSRGPQVLSKIDLLLGANQFELGNEDRHAALDYYEVEKDSSLCMACISSPVKAVVSVKRKKMKKGLGLGFCRLGPYPKGKRAATGWRRKRLGAGLGLGLFCLGVGMGKSGVGLGLVPGPVGLVPGLVFGPFRPDFGSSSGLIGPVTGLFPGLSEISRPNLSEVSLESSMVVDVQIRPEDASSMVAGFSGTSSPGFNKQNGFVGAYSSGESDGDGFVSAGSMGTGRALVQAALDPTGDESGSFSTGGIDTRMDHAGDGPGSFSAGGGSISTIASNGSIFNPEMEDAGIGPESASPARSVYSL
jgi:hypothetical protein